MSKESIMKPFSTDMGHFAGPNAESDTAYARLNSKDQAAMDKFVSRANHAYAWTRKNGLPAGYDESAKIYNEFLRKNGNAGTINLEDLYALDSTISETIWDADVFSKLGIPSGVMAKPRFEIKDYLVQSEEWPRFSKEFRNPAFMRLKETSQFTNGIGLHLGISIPFTELNESQGALWSPQAMLMQELAAKFGLMKSRRGFLGSSCANATGDDGSDASTYGITGLFNYASIQACHAGIGGDGNIQDQGDLEFTLRTMFTLIKKVYQPGKYVIVSTSGAASHLFYERDTYQQQLDLQRVKEFLSHIGVTQSGGIEWWVTEQLTASTPAAATQHILLMKVAPSLIRRHIIYPQQMLPMLNKTYERDLQENMIFADALQIKKVDTTNNAVPLVKCSSSAVVADTVGFIPDGTRIL